VNGTEIEATFGIDRSEVDRVYEALTRPTASALGTVSVRIKPPRTVLHFYLAGTGEYLAGTDERPRRLRVRRRRDGLLISLESKQVLREDQLSIEKLERTEIPDMSLADAAVLLASGTKIISSFVKNQYRVTLESEAGLLKASLDQMLPFLPDRPTVRTEPFWHVEFEEISWPLADFLKSALFSENFAALRPLEESKWLTATLAPPAFLPLLPDLLLRDYFHELFGCGASAMRRVRHYQRA
jgi:hypothetical protein